MQDMRRLLKSDEGMVAGAQFHIKRNTGNFGTINYMASQDGFTLYDTVTYNYLTMRQMVRTITMEVIITIPGTVE